MRANQLIRAILLFITPLLMAADSGHAPLPTTQPVMAASAVAQPPMPATQPAESIGVSADEAIQMLNDGNARFVSQSPQRPHQDSARLNDTFSNGQHPYAAVLSCADSRVPVELIFDAGFGDLFTTRVAGNVANTDEIGTIEYGVEHLGINLILVLGHTKCGAVTAVVNKSQVTPSIEKLVENIVPAAQSAQKMYPQLSGARLVEKAIRYNVTRQMRDLASKSEVIAEKFRTGNLKIVGAVYDLHTGEIDWLEPITTAGISEVPPKSEPSAKIESHEVSSEKPAAHAESPRTAVHEQPAEHNKSAVHTESKPVEPKHDASHEKEPADPHTASAGEPRASAEHPASKDEPAVATKPVKPRKENFLAFGGLLGGASAMSCGVLYLLKGRSTSRATAEDKSEAPVS